jgi:pimeloyl-ACP methyl ester carboxylesterase
MSTTIVGTPPIQPEARPSIRRLRRGQVIGGILLLTLLLVVILTAFGAPLWQVLGTGILLLAVAVVVLLALGTLVITLVIAAVTRRRTRMMPWLQRLLRLFLVLLILLVGVASAVVGSQWYASTPPILSANGKILPGSIATMEQVTLNGSQQWITIRGKNTHNPVLLYPTGGPGQGGFPANQGELAPLEDHFMVVNWDQPDTARSYGAVPLAELTPQRFVSDAHALVQQLRARFHQDKIYVYGQSWGSILGIWLVQQYPQLFYAFIGHGQMVNVVETEVMGYQLALKYATEHGDTATVETLRRNGPPPYTGDGLIEKEEAFQKVAMHDELGPLGNLPWYVIFSLMPAFSPEYGLLDKVNYVRGFNDVFTVMFPQMLGIDFTTQANKLQVPVYFLVGRNDTNAMPSLVQQYYNVLQAPHKELIWFNSGHGLGADQNQFVDVMVNHVLKQTWPGR